MHPLDLKAKSLAKEYLHKEKELMEVLSLIEKERIFEILGFSSLFRYALSLGIAENQAYTLIGVSRKCEQVPELKRAIDEGVLNASRARRILPVVTIENSKEWIEKAATLPQKTVENLVLRENPEARVKDRIKMVTPHLCELRLGITPALEEKLQRSRELASQSAQKNRDMVAALEDIVDFYLKHKDPVMKVEREKKVLATKREGPDKVLASRRVTPTSRYIPRNVFHQVMRKDRGVCQGFEPDGHACQNRQFIQVHHIKAFSAGGDHSPENLITLCSAHHRQLHTPKKTNISST